MSTSKAHKATPSLTLVGLASLGFLVPSAGILQMLAVSWHLTRLGSAISLLPLVIGCGAVARIGTSAFWGQVVRRYGAYRSCVVLLLSAAVCQGVVAGILFGLAPLGALAITELGLGAAFSGVAICRQTMLKDAVAFTGAGSEAAAGINRGVGYASKLLFPIAGGLLVAALGTTQCVSLCTVILCLGVIVLFVLKRELRCLGQPTLESAPQNSLGQGIRSAIAFYRSNSAVAKAVALTTIFNFVLAPLGVILPLFVGHLENGSSALLGLSESTLGCGAIAGALLFAKYRRGHVALFACCAAVAYATIGCASLFHADWAYWMFNVALLALGGTVAYAGSASDSLIMKSLGRDAYARAIGAQMLLVGSAYPLGLLMAATGLRIFGSIVVLAGLNAVACFLAAGALSVSTKTDRG